MSNRLDDLDEVGEDRLRDEVARRGLARANGLCDYCDRPIGSDPPCKFHGRHHWPDVAAKAARDVERALHHLAETGQQAMPTTPGDYRPFTLHNPPQAPRWHFRMVTYVVGPPSPYVDDIPLGDVPLIVFDLGRARSMSPEWQRYMNHVASEYPNVEITGCNPTIKHCLARRKLEHALESLT